MNIEILTDADAVARKAAEFIAAAARATVAERGRFIMAVSGGHTASLVPGDPVLKVTDVDVALTGGVSGTAPNDVDVSHAQSFTPRSVVGNWER